MFIINSFSFLETIAAHKSSVEAISACSSQDYFVSAGRDSTINIWNSSTLRPKALPVYDKYLCCHNILRIDRNPFHLQILPQAGRCENSW